MRDLRRAERKRARVELKIKKKLLSGAAIAPGRFTVALRLRPGRKAGSTNPDDYDLILSQVN